MGVGCNDFSQYASSNLYIGYFEEKFSLFKQI